MQFVPTKIPDVIMIKPKIFGDERGFFMEMWQKEIYSRNGIDAEFVQQNYSRSGTGILRGLHYQINHPQGKLVTVASGRVFDVAIDLRRWSPTFGDWIGEYLSEENHNIVWIPPGFAHGFLVMDGPADFQYMCTDYYAPESERCIRWDDPALAIEWPVDDEMQPIVSDKDRTGSDFPNAEIYEHRF